MKQTILVITNVPDEQTAQMMARHLVQERLAACVNYLPGISSVYRWQGRVEVAQELTMLIKTKQESYADVEQYIKDAHPYDIPEIIAVPIVAGWSPYLNWIEQETNRDGND